MVELAKSVVRSTDRWRTSQRIRWYETPRIVGRTCAATRRPITDANKRRRAVCGSADTLLDRMAKDDPDHPPFPTLRLSLTSLIGYRISEIPTLSATIISPIR